MTRARRQQGLALLLAILVVAVLTLTVFPFLYEGRVERAVATNLYTTLQARHLAEGGVVIAEAVLQTDEKEDRAGVRGQPPYDGLKETWAQFNNVPIAAGGGAASMVVTDEQGKLNLNSIMQNPTTPNRQRKEQIQRLLGVLELDLALVDPLIDWLDGDNNPTDSAGAEESYYLGLTPPYKPANGKLQSVAELGLIKGWTREVVEKVAPFVTIYGSGQVNPNTAPRQVLVALGLDPSQADAVIAYREKTPFRNGPEISNVPGVTTGPIVSPFLTPKSAAFSVTVTGSFRDSIAIVRAVLTRGATAERVYWRVE